VNFEKVVGSDDGNLRRRHARQGRDRAFSRPVIFLEFALERST